MVNDNVENLILARKPINGAEYQILNTKNDFNDICCLIIKITDQQTIEIGQFKNIQTAKETLKLLDGNDNIGRKIRIKVKYSDDIYIGKVMLWTYGESSRIEILGSKEGEKTQSYLIFDKYINRDAIIEYCEFID